MRTEKVTLAYDMSAMTSQHTCKLDDTETKKMLLTLVDISRKYSESGTVPRMVAVDVLAVCNTAAGTSSFVQIKITNSGRGMSKVRPR